MNNLLEETMKQNPELTMEEWQEIKKNFMLLIFEQNIAENPELLKKF